MIHQIYKLSSVKQVQDDIRSIMPKDLATIHIVANITHDEISKCLEIISRKQHCCIGSITAQEDVAETFSSQA